MAPKTITNNVMSKTKMNRFSDVINIQNIYYKIMFIMYIIIDIRNIPCQNCQPCRYQ